MSDLLIRGMKKPKTCFECYFCTYGFCAHLNRYVTDSANIDEDCPMKELLPHGRLKDADALLQKQHGMVVMALDIIEAPTIIEAEEVADE